MEIQIGVIGCINDQKFTTSVTGETDPQTGRAVIHLEYSNIPALWHPFNYSDPLVLLSDYHEADGFNFRSLAHSGFTASCTIDFGQGRLLRKTADIHWSRGVLRGGYAIWGSAYCPDIVEAEPYEEYMHPVGDDMIGIGIARWRRASGKIVEACVSARYKFAEATAVQKIPQVRRAWPELALSSDGLTVIGKYDTTIRAMARAVLGFEAAAN